MTTAVRPRPATAKAEPPHHNNLTCYKQYRCRLPACVERHRTYQRTVARRQAYGTWQPLIDVEPVRQHILNLRDAGVTLQRLAQVTGLPTPSINGILYDLGANKPRRKHLRPETAVKILAVTPEHAAPGVIDATGTRRRIEALQVAGWPKKDIAARLGINVATAGRITRQAVVLASTAYAVATLYQRLRVVAPEDHGITPWIVDRTRRYATSQGWHGPLAWDGNIDDPAAVPDVENPPDPDFKRDEIAEQRREEVWLLRTAAVSREEIAARVGISPETVRVIVAEFRTGKKKDRSKQAVTV